MKGEVKFEGLDELFDYKNQLLDDLLTSKTVLRLLSDECDPNVHPEDLMYKQVYPYEFVPETVEHGQTFICCEVDIRDIRFSPVTDYQGRVLTFAATDYNRLHPTGKRIPANRKTEYAIH